MNEGLSLEESNKRLQWYEKRYGPYIDKRGLKNVKNLFRMPTMYEWVILFMLILTLFLSWAYNEDTKRAREMVNNLPVICSQYKESLIKDSSAPSIINPQINLSNQISNSEG